MLSNIYFVKGSVMYVLVKCQLKIQARREKIYEFKIIKKFAKNYRTYEAKKKFTEIK